MIKGSKTSVGLALAAAGAGILLGAADCEPRKSPSPAISNELPVSPGAWCPTAEAHGVDKNGHAFICRGASVDGRNHWEKLP